MGNPGYDLPFGNRKTLEEIGRGGAHQLHSPSFIKIQEILSKEKQRDFCIAWKDDFFNGNYLNAWLSYLARYNRVWVTNPQLSDVNLKDLPSGERQIFKGQTQDFLLLTSNLLHPFVCGKSVRHAWSYAPYHLWQISGQDWIFLADIENPNGLERDGGEEFFWVGKGDTVLRFIAGREGIAVFQAQFYPGPSLPEKPSRLVSISTDAGYEGKMQIDGPGAHSFAVPVKAGQSLLKIHSLDRASLSRLPTGDPRPLLLQIRNLRMLQFQERKGPRP